MNGFQEKLRTNERTDERTNKGEFIGPTSEVGGSKNVEVDQSHRLTVLVDGTNRSKPHDIIIVKSVAYKRRVCKPSYTGSSA